MRVTPQAGNRQRIRGQDQRTEQLRAEGHVPTLGRGIDDFSMVSVEDRCNELFQLPMISVEFRPFGKTCDLHVAFIVETIAGHAIQHTVGLHGVDVNELFTLTVPHTVPATLRVAAALSQGPV